MTTKSISGLDIRRPFQGGRRGGRRRRLRRLHPVERPPAGLRLSGRRHRLDGARGRARGRHGRRGRRRAASGAATMLVVAGAGLACAVVGHGARRRGPVRPGQDRLRRGRWATGWARRSPSSPTTCASSSVLARRGRRARRGQRLLAPGTHAPAAHQGAADRDLLRGGLPDDRLLGARRLLGAGHDRRALLQRCTWRRRWATGCACGSPWSPWWPRSSARWRSPLWSRALPALPLPLAGLPGRQRRPHRKRGPPPAAGGRRAP